MIVYHYTTGHKLPDIIREHTLRRTPLKPKPMETPICWLSTNDVFEETCRKSTMLNGEAVLLDKKSLSEAGCGLFRFVIDTSEISNEVIPWSILKHKAKIKSATVKRMVKRGKAVGASSKDWHGSLLNIRIDSCKLEFLHNENWIPLSFSDALSALPKDLPKSVTVKNSNATMNNNIWKDHKSS